MKKFLLPAMFAIALAGSAFTRFSHANTSAKKDTLAYYVDDNNMCQQWDVTDGDCILDNLDYMCIEYVYEVGWTQMYQYNIGGVCLQPYYSWFPTCPGCIK